MKIGVSSEDVKTVKEAQVVTRSSVHIGKVAIPWALILQGNFARHDSGFIKNMSGYRCVFFVWNWYFSYRIVLISDSKVA